MAKKKSFKGGIGNLLKESIDNSKKIETIDNDKLDWLEQQIQQKDLELWKWRTGKLTVDLFHKTLADFNLKYNSRTNDFEKIEKE